MLDANRWWLPSLLFDDEWFCERGPRSSEAFQALAFSGIVDPRMQKLRHRRANWRDKGEDLMATEILKQQMEDLREKLAQPHTNPKDLHDQVQGMVDLLKANHETVPADLREAIEELQAEILEDFYDNLPV